MAKMTGIGGVFIYADETAALADWYTRHLSFQFAHMGENDQSMTYYQVFTCHDLDRSDKKLSTVFAIMPAAEKLDAPRNQAMVNYRVDDMEALVDQLNQAGIATDPIEIWAEGDGSGKFTHLHDPEGNRIELWQPF